MEEIWKDIEGYEGLYQVSNLGRVRSLPRRTTKGKILKTFIDYAGYEIVTLCNTNKKNPSCKFRVHRLVAQAFITNPNELPQVNHIDGNKLNNSAENLEWVTAKENINHRYNVLKQRNPTPFKDILGKDFPNAKKIIQFDIKGNEIKRYGCISDASQEILENRRNTSLICSVCKGKRKTAYGYIWKYEE